MFAAATTPLFELFFGSGSFLPVPPSSTSTETGFGAMLAESADPEPTLAAVVPPPTVLRDPLADAEDAEEGGLDLLDFGVLRPLPIPVESVPSLDPMPEPAPSFYLVAPDATANSAPAADEAVSPPTEPEVEEAKLGGDSARVLATVSSVAILQLPLSPVVGNREPVEDPDLVRSGSTPVDSQTVVTDPESAAPGERVPSAEPKAEILAESPKASPAPPLPPSGQPSQGESVATGRGETRPGGEIFRGAPTLAETPPLENVWIAKTEGSVEANNPELSQKGRAADLGSGPIRSALARMKLSGSTRADQPVARPRIAQLPMAHADLAQKIALSQPQDEVPGQSPASDSPLPLPVLDVPRTDLPTPFAANTGPAGKAVEVEIAPDVESESSSADQSSPGSSSDHRSTFATSEAMPSPLSPTSVAATTPQAATAPPASDSLGLHASVQRAVARTIVQMASDQLLASAAPRTAVVELDPQHLGRVRVEVQQLTGGRIAIELTASAQETRLALQTDADDMVRQLKRHSVDVQRLEVRSEIESPDRSSRSTRGESFRERSNGFDDPRSSQHQSGQRRSGRQPAHSLDLTDYRYWEAIR